MHKWTRTGSVRKRPNDVVAPEILAEAQVNRNTPLPQNDSISSSTQGTDVALDPSISIDRKNELCSYLNLMKQPAGKVGNENNPLLKRRSLRIRKVRKVKEEHLQNQELTANEKCEHAENNNVQATDLKQQLCLDINSRFKHIIFKGKSDVLNSAVMGSLNMFTFKSLENSETFDNYTALTRPLKDPVSSEPTDMGTVPEIEIAAYKDSCNASVSIIYCVKKDFKIDESAACDVLKTNQFYTRIQGMQHNQTYPNTPPLFTGGADQDMSESMNNNHHEAKQIEDAIDVESSHTLAVITSPIIDVIHVASKTDAANMVVPHASEDAPVKDCVFVDLSRRSHTPAPYVHPTHSDHTYCVPPSPARPAMNMVRRRTQHVPADNAAILPRDGGAVIGCYYAGYHLVVAQTERVSFFQQSGLGMFLESQGMWIPRSDVARLSFDDTCVRKTTRDCILHTPDQGIVYVEFFCKEHIHENCMVPGCDLFVVLYYRRNTDHVPTRKIHQLDKFTGYAKHVQFVVVQELNCVTVYFESLVGTMSSSTSNWQINSYCFTPDYQSVEVYKHEKSPHRIESLHVVEDDYRMTVGCAPDLMSFWLMEKLVHTIKLPSDTDLAKTTFRCDRGFIFALQQLPRLNCLRLTAINLADYTHKPLQLYKPPRGFNRLRKACMRDGEIVAFYRQGRACWNMETGMLISCGASSRPTWPYGKWLITVRQRRVYVCRMLKAMRRRQSRTIRLCNSSVRSRRRRRRAHN